MCVAVFGFGKVGPVEGRLASVPTPGGDIECGDHEGQCRDGPANDVEGGHRSLSSSWSSWAYSRYRVEAWRIRSDMSDITARASVSTRAASRTNAAAGVSIPAAWERRVCRGRVIALLPLAHPGRSSECWPLPSSHTVCRPSRG